MGYVNNTNMSEFIPPSAISKTGGTWTPAVSNNVVSEARTAADAAFTLLVPVTLPGSNAPKLGAMLKSIDVYYKIGTAAADDFATVSLCKMALKANGTAPAGAVVTTTIDAGHGTAALRKAVGDHTLNVALSAAAYLGSNDHYVLSLVVDAAATSVFTLFGARVNYELRI